MSRGRPPKSRSPASDDTSVTPTIGHVTNQDQAREDGIALGDRGASVGRDAHGIISTGDHATNIQIRAETVLPPDALRPATDVEAPPGLRRLSDRAELFVGRHQELAALEERLAADRDPVVVLALHGLGGIGKSTLAARYAASSGLNPVWWITADTPANIEAGLASLTIALQPGLSTVLPQRILSNIG